MDQSFKTEGEIKAKLTKINSRGKPRMEWTIEDEANACASCLICNHYKYNHDNLRLLQGTFIHICMVGLSADPNNFIDITNQLQVTGLNTSCIESFSRRALL